MSADHEKVEHMAVYQRRAQELAQKVTAEWEETHAGETRGLTDAVYRALVEEANLELRQILTQISGNLELARLRAAKGKEAFTPEGIDNMLGAVERASGLAEVYLDHAAAAKLVIRIELSEFDLSEALAGYLQANRLTNIVEANLESAPVIADQRKLLDALGHLVTRFYFAAREGERVVVQCAAADGRIEGFVGLIPSHVSPESLMEEMRAPLAIEDVGIDVGYAKAVLERHGGLLFVATAGEHSAGFGFHMPILGGAA